MDFDEVTYLAQKQGITEDELKRIKETELRINQLKDEAKAWEVKLAERKLQALAPTQPAQQAPTALPLTQHYEEHEKPLLELNSHLYQQNQLHIQKMSTLINTQDRSLSQVIKTEMERAVREFKKEIPCESEAGSINDTYSNESCSTISGAEKSSEQPVKSSQEQVKKKQKKKVEQKQPTKKKENDYYKHMPKPATDSPASSATQIKSHQFASCLLGDCNTLSVPNVKELATSNDLAFSSYHTLSKCPCRVRLCLMFGSAKELNVHILLRGIDGQPLLGARVFKASGLILHKSGSFSPLFEGTSQQLMELNSETDLHIKASVQLKTQSLKATNVKAKQLEERHFIIDNSLKIKWCVTVENPSD